MKFSRAKYLFLFAITLFVCFGIGFAIGAFPQRWKAFRGKDSSGLLILFSDEKMIPTQTLLDFEKTTGIHIESKAIASFALFQTEAQKADLMFAPLSWFGSLHDIVQPLISSESYTPFLFSDFSTLQLSPESFLPVFWNVEHAKSKESGDEMSFWGFFTAQSDETRQARAQDFLLYLLGNPKHLKHWTEQVQKPTTLDMEEVKDEFQPQHIRQYQLLHTKILNQLEKTDTP